MPSTPRAVTAASPMRSVSTGPATGTDSVVHAVAMRSWAAEYANGACPEVSVRAMYAKATA